MSEAVYQAPSISPEEYEMYRGRHVALYEGKIMAEGSRHRYKYRPSHPKPEMERTRLATRAPS